MGRTISSLYSDDGVPDACFGWWVSVSPARGMPASDRGSNGDEDPSRALALTLGWS